MTPDPKTCRWLDRLFGNVCRNRATHPNVVTFTEEQTREMRARLGLPPAHGRDEAFVEPLCTPCANCGYQPITPATPAWDADGEEGGKTE